MDTEGAHAFVDQLAKLLELDGVGIIIGGVGWPPSFLCDQGSRWRMAGRVSGMPIQPRSRHPARARVAGRSGYHLDDHCAAHVPERGASRRHHRDPNFSQLLARDRDRGMLAMAAGPEGAGRSGGPLCSA
jgi:hypothetical protein